jgi:hypothetical protein
MKADKDDSVPTPEAADGATVSGKPREFLKYAPMWAAHPDHDRVRSHSGSTAGWALKRQPRQCLQPASTGTETGGVSRVRQAARAAGTRASPGRPIIPRGCVELVFVLFGARNRTVARLCFSWTQDVGRSADSPAMCAQVLFLNTAVKTLWPYYNNAVGKMVLEQVGPALEPVLAQVRTRALPAAHRAGAVPLRYRQSGCQVAPHAMDWAAAGPRCAAPADTG